MKTLTFNKIISLLTLGFIIINFGIVLYFFPYLPENIHSHYNLLGNADDKANRFIIFLLPGLSLLMYFLLEYFIRKPEIMNFPVKVTEENRKELYFVAVTMINFIRFLLILLLLYVSMSVVYNEIKGIKQIYAPVVYLFIVLIFLTLFVGIKKIYNIK